MSTSSSKGYLLGIDLLLKFSDDSCALAIIAHGVWSMLTFMLIQIHYHVICLLLVQILDCKCAYDGRWM